MDAVWITWESQQRNRSMARELGINCVEIVHDDKGRLERYFQSMGETFRLLRRRRPAVVCFQNPSLVLGIFLITIRGLGVGGRYRLVGDFHNAGVEPRFGRGISRFIARQSDLVIVTNENLAKIVRGWGAQASAIPDPLPHLGFRERRQAYRTPAPTILFICSWAPDEPVENVLIAARELQHRYPAAKIRVTGRPRAQRLPSNLPANVELTGFLSKDDFHRAIAGADLVMDLTTRDNCMVCGAYEGLSLEKPLLLSANEPTMAWFNKGALFTDNSAEDIAAKLAMACSQMGALTDEAKTMKQEVSLKFQRLIDQLGRQLAIG